MALFFRPKMIRNRPVYALADGSVFLYSKVMYTDLVIRLMMCGYTRTEAIIIADDYDEDELDLLEAVVESMEEVKRNERVARIQSLTCKSKGR